MTPQTFVFWREREDGTFVPVIAEVEFRERIAAIARFDPTISLVEPKREQRAA